MDRTRIDHIHQFIVLDDDIHRIATAAPTRRELDRLHRVRQLGLIQRVHPLAKHSKLEHALGLCHLAKLACEHVQGINRAGIEKPALCVAALLHNVGHFSQGFPTEQAAITLYHCHPPTKKTIDSWVQAVQKGLKCEKCSRDCHRFLDRADHQKLFRWISAKKILENDVLPDNIKGQVARYVVCQKSTGYNLLAFLDRLEYTVRDSFYLGMLSVGVNWVPLLRECQVSKEGQVERGATASVLSALSRHLSQRVYNNPRVAALAQVFAKLIASSVLDGATRVEEMASWNDERMDSYIGKTKVTYMKRETTLASILNNVGPGSIGQALEMRHVHLKKHSPLMAEAAIVHTRGKGLCQYPLGKGFFVRCTKERIPLDFLLGPQKGHDYYQTSFVYDPHARTPRHILDAVTTAEEAIQCPQDDLKVKIVGFLLGKRTGDSTERYYEALEKHIAREFREYGDNPEKQANSLLKKGTIPQFKRGWFSFLADATSALTRDFIEAAEHYKEDFLEQVVDSLAKIRARPREGEEIQQARQRKETAVEFSYYLKWLQKVRKADKQHWVVPGVRIYQDDGSQWTDVDVFIIQRSNESSRVEISLVECTTSGNDTKELDAKKKLNQVAHCLKKRFSPRSMKITTFLNDQQLPKHT